MECELQMALLVTWIMHNRGATTLPRGQLMCISQESIGWWPRHSSQQKRFAGFKEEEKQSNVEVHREYIYGGHVAAHIKTLTEDEPEKCHAHFREYIKKGIEP
ncbi:60S ribosomal protein L5 [Thalictrum thalictroides]|uniref:60S ribosomal protein L5 n=1 Tax=Thalictrum thalictroides TaxID=46969 RepID=A0A7J6V6N3_THATH|nr:60S ribosomal protein L5 [Thalictrum thalictroides]